MQRDIRLSEKVVFDLSYSNVPDGAGLVLYLVRNNPDVAAEVYYTGATGPLMFRPVPIDGSGSKSLEWDGANVGCAPSDYATWCPIQPGKYKLTAMLLEHADQSIVGWPDPSRESPLVEVSSEAFLVTGPTDLRPLAFDMVGGLTSRLTEKFGLQSKGVDIARDLGWQSYQKGWPDQLPARTEDGYCLEARLLPPFDGRLRACAPLSILDETGLHYGWNDIRVDGDPAYQPNTLTYEEAAKIALEQTVDGLNAYELSDFPLGDWGYRYDGGGFWIFNTHVCELKSGESVSDACGVEKLVRVNNDRTACVVYRAPYRERSGMPDLLWDDLTCVQ